MEEPNNLPTFIPLEEYLQKDRPNRRILSIQSHVLSSSLINNCVIFPLQLHGYRIDHINSVQFSNRTQYESGARGRCLTENDLKLLFEGLQRNHLQTNYSHVLSGYCGDASFLCKLASIVQECRQHRPDLIYVCDPVMGDNGRYHVSKELRDIYLKQVLPLANVITPNAFELSELTNGLPVDTEEQCLRAMGHLHAKFPNIQTIVCTSAGEDVETIKCYATQRTAQNEFRLYRFDIPKIPSNCTLVGTGCTFAALLLLWLDETDGNLVASIRAVIASLQAVIKRTAKAITSAQPSMAERELKMVEFRLDLLRPRAEAINFTTLVVPGGFSKSTILVFGLNFVDKELQDTFTKFFDEAEDEFRIISSDHYGSEYHYMEMSSSNGRFTLDLANAGKHKKNFWKMASCVGAIVAYQSRDFSRNAGTSGESESIPGEKFTAEDTIQESQTEPGIPILITAEFLEGFKRDLEQHTIRKVPIAFFGSDHFTNLRDVFEWLLKQQEELTDSEKVDELSLLLRCLQEENEQLRASQAGNVSNVLEKISNEPKKSEERTEATVLKQGKESAEKVMRTLESQLMQDAVSVQRSVDLAQTPHSEQMHLSLERSVVPQVECTSSRGCRPNANNCRFACCTASATIQLIRFCAAILYLNELILALFPQKIVCFPPKMC